MQPHNLYTLNRRKALAKLCIRYIILFIYLVVSFIVVWHEKNDDNNKSIFVIYILAVIVQVVSTFYFAIIDIIEYRDIAKAYKNMIPNYISVLEPNRINILNKINKLWCEQHSKEPIMCYLHFEDVETKNYYFETEKLLKNKSKKKDNFSKDEKTLHDKILKSIGNVVYYEDTSGDINEFLLHASRNNSRSNNKINILLYNSKEVLSQEILKKFKFYRISYVCEQNTKNSEIIFDKPLIINSPSCLKNVYENIYETVYNETLNIDKAKYIIEIIDGDLTKLLYYNEYPERRKALKAFLSGEEIYNIQKLSKESKKLSLEGKYEQAYVLINQAIKEYKNEVLCNKQIYYELFLQKADILHLLNKYNEALDILKVLQNKYSVFDRDSKVLFLMAHCKKHQGDFYDALNLLDNPLISNNPVLNFNIKRRSIGSYLLRFWEFGDINDLAIATNIVNETNKKLIHINNFMSTNSQDNYQGLLEIQGLYSNICDFYNTLDKKSLPNLILKQQNYINNNFVNNEKLKPNAKFVLAELYRLVEDYDNAISEYFDCYESSIRNNDFNLQSQVIVMLKLLSLQGITTPIYWKNILKVYDTCINYNMRFNAELCKIIQYAESKLPNNKLNMFDKPLVIL